MNATNGKADHVIVVGIDGSDASKDALRWAAHQAEATGAHLQAVTTWHVPVVPYGPVPFPGGLDFSQDTNRVLQDTIKAVLGDSSSVDVTPVVVEGYPVPELLKAASSAVLLVVGSRGHGAFAGMLLGSVSDHLASHSPCPVVVVRCAGSDRAGGVVVVGVDGSNSSKDALGWAAQQAEITGASLKVVSTWYTPTMVYGPGVLPFPADFDPEHDSRGGLEAAIRDTLGEDPKVKVSTVVVEGHPAPELLKQSEGADLLVVGSRGHGAFAGMLLGSVSEHCLSHASCPVVVVRHAGP